MGLDAMVIVVAEETETVNLVHSFVATPVDDTPPHHINAAFKINAIQPV